MDKKAIYKLAVDFLERAGYEAVLHANYVGRAPSGEETLSIETDASGRFWRKDALLQRSRLPGHDGNRPLPAGASLEAISSIRGSAPRLTLMMQRSGGAHGTRPH